MNKSNIKYFVLAILLIGLFSCGEGDKAKALQSLEQAKKHYALGNYEQARVEIDSLSAKYPKAYEERRMALAFLDTVRRAMDVQTVKRCDSILVAMQPDIDALLKSFIFDRNEEYQDIGVFYPRETFSAGKLSYTGLVSGVQEDGFLFLESVFIGSTKHNRMRISASGGESLESGKVLDDGFNNRFSTLGKQFEVIRYSGENENGIAKFIKENANKQLTVSLEGSGKNSFQLSSQLKQAIRKAYDLSEILLSQDSIRSVKGEAEFKIRYLDNKKEIEDINKELEENNESLKDVD